jgi:hypothetical protein
VYVGFIGARTFVCRARKVRLAQCTLPSVFVFLRRLQGFVATREGSTRWATATCRRGEGYEAATTRVSSRHELRE